LQAVARLHPVRPVAEEALATQAAAVDSDKSRWAEVVSTAVPHPVAVSMDPQREADLPAGPLEDREGIILQFIVI
jgi:hypothetical protein